MTPGGLDHSSRRAFFMRSPRVARDALAGVGDVGDSGNDDD
jgi:hypothetical protein